MSQLRSVVIGCLLACGVLLAVPARAGAQTAADLFNDQVLQDVRLLMNSRDLALMRANYQLNTYYPADLVWRGLRIRNVGVRTRGTGSRNPVKMGLRLDFNRYSKNQKFVGLTSLVLDNEWQDASLIREVLAMSIYRRMGLPAPRESFAKVYINNEYQGVYALVEPVDTLFTARTLNDSTGYLYEYRYVMPFYTEYLGDDLAPYKLMFQPQSHELEGDSALYGPIRDMFREINEPDDAVWRERVEDRLDLAQFMTHAAVQAFLAENDGLLGYAGLNNFYLYRPAGKNTHRILPWDEDFAFSFITSSLFRRGEQPVLLFERAFAQPDLRTLFLDVAESLAHSVTETGWLSEEIERLVALIGPAVVVDTRKQFSNEAFFAEIDFLREFAATRTGYVLNEIATMR